MATNALRPGFRVEVEGFIPHGCKRFNINLGKDSNNLVIHFDVRFDHQGDQGKIVLNTMKDGAWGKEQKEGFFPFQAGSDTKISFTFENDKIIIKLPSGSHLSFPIRFPITDITFVSVEELKSKSITLT
ncbi:galectin-1-like isoform X2 [Rana temporaria]|uniref:galectin-1-like isoform X1 n=1 Tax=Rana temporaria TaxID=8407 RepID=UPI001AACE1C4|nr:galectin-1-like isoform X1 [Rana temporaria]XP_040214660.1 galectin-1-like isoform X2 [Rana temporaria]